MKHFLSVILIICGLTIPQYACAEDEVVLDAKTESTAITENVSQSKTDGLTLYEKIQNIKSKEYRNDEVNNLLGDILTKHFETGIVEDVEIFGYYRDGFTMDIPDDSDSDFKYRINVLQAGLKGNFKDGKTQYEASFKFDSQHKYKYLQFMPTNLFISNTSIPHHTIMVGNMRTPTGIAYSFCTSFSNRKNLWQY